MSQNRKILVTSALPYANGDIHLGHLVEYIQTDIWVRFQKLRGNTCHYMCADDTHGTPIMLKAKSLGISPEDLIAGVHKEHVADFKAFHIEFDHYYSTNSEENRILSEEVYTKAKSAGAIEEREIEQLYCPHDAMFLPDRFIKGTCPKCGAENQYGDSCEVCSATYSPTELQNAACAVCGTTPVLKPSNHHFFKLSQFADVIQGWVNGSHVKPEIQNKLKEWFSAGLKDWDISRDAPYFGFKIPGTEDKYFYVWMDAPVGYIATTQSWAQQNGLTIDTIWKSGDYEIHHFIGKDILYFHTLFWPAMLKVAGYQLPTKVNVHGFLTVNGEKMSKSRGTFILARKYSEQLNPEFLRYYYASKLNGGIDDLDLNLDDFILKVNADIVNKIVNIGSRLGSILNKKLDGVLGAPCKDGEQLLAEIRGAKDTIASLYETLDYHKAMKTIIGLADKANQYIDTKAPWSVVKTDEVEAKAICSTGLNALKMLAIYLKPVMPILCNGIFTFLNTSVSHWDDVDTLLPHQAIEAYQHLANRLEAKDVAYLTEA